MSLVGNKFKCYKAGASMANPRISMEAYRVETQNTEEVLSGPHRAKLFTASWCKAGLILVSWV